MSPTSSPHPPPPPAEGLIRRPGFRLAFSISRRPHYNDRDIYPALWMALASDEGAQNRFHTSQAEWYLKGIDSGAVESSDTITDNIPIEHVAYLFLVISSGTSRSFYTPVWNTRGVDINCLALWVLPQPRLSLKSRCLLHT